MMGQLIRVLPGFFASRPADFTALVNGPERYVVFLLLSAAVREGEVTIVGDATVPERNQPFPLFRAYGGLPDPATKKVTAPWWLWDGNRAWKVGPLTGEMRELSIRTLWDATMLIHKLVTGWDPRNEGVEGDDESAANLGTNESATQRPSGVVATQDIPTDERSDQDDEDERPEQAVLIFLKLSDDAFGQADEREALFGLEDRLEEVIVQIGGTLDGHEFGAGFCTFYLYGASAEALFETASPLLRQYPIRDGSYAIKRYGPPGSSVEERVNLTIA